MNTETILALTALIVAVVGLYLGVRASLRSRDLSAQVQSLIIPPEAPDKTAGLRKEKVMRVEMETSDHGVKVVAYKNNAFNASYANTDLERALYIARCELKDSEPSRRRLLTGKDLH